MGRQAQRRAAGRGARGGRRAGTPTGSATVPVTGPDAAPSDGPPPGPANGAGTTALVCGAAALVLSLLGFLVLPLAFAAPLAPTAVVAGFLGRARVRRGLATNRRAATAGIVLGALSLAVIVGWVVVAASLFTDPARNLADCLDRAGTPQAETQCRQDFADDLRSRVDG